nr:hypothetical protein [uncultured Reyranella sp.]
MKAAEFDIKVDAVSVLQVQVTEHDIESLGRHACEDLPRFYAAFDRHDVVLPTNEVFTHLAPKVGIVFNEKNSKRHVFNQRRRAVFHAKAREDSRQASPYECPKTG